MQRKKWVWLTIRAGFSLSLLGLLFWKTDLSRFSIAFRNMNALLFLVSFLSFLLLFLPMSYRWQIILRVLGIDAPIQKLYKTYLVGVFFNNFFPTTIGGDIVRGYSLYQFTQKGKEAVVSVMVERFLGFTSLIMIAVAALALTYPSLHDPLLAWLILAAFLVYLVALIAMVTPTIFSLADRCLQKLRSPKLGSKLVQLPEVISLYKSSPFILSRLVFFSLILQSLAILIYYILCRSLHLDIPLIDIFLFLPMISLVSMIPISLGGLGIREGMTVYLFQKIGIDSAHALSLSLAWFSIILLSSAVGGAIFAFQRTHTFPTPTPTGTNP
jgi:glycosyltransferase 2 family protein